MPKTSRYKLPPADELPDTLKRSPRESQEAFTRALATAVQAYGEGDHAVGAAYAEFKRAFEKRGDHWIAKSIRPPEPAWSPRRPGPLRRDHEFLRRSVPAIRSAVARHSSASAPP